MKITYINHSGFLVETENCYYVFDYYKGEMPRLDKSKEVVVFCSHFHQDHFNPKIFEILDDMGMNYQAVLAKDISKKKYPATYSGVAFIVKTSEGIIYHAGDLNDWHWEGETEADNRHMTSMYRAEIDKIKGAHFDAAFVPLDPRQEEHYADGMLYFLKHVDCNAVFPMHYWNEPSVIDRLITEYPQYKSRIKNTESAKGEEI